jgi:hypothetical protein
MSTIFKTKPRNLTYSSSINVSNSINNKRLTDRSLEFYCILSTFAFFSTTTPANYSVLKKFYEQETGLTIHIETIKGYLEKFFYADLLKIEKLENRSGKFYLHLGVNISSSEYRTGINTFDNAKQNFTPFYIRQYKNRGNENKNPLIKGAVGVGHFMSSKPEYWQHRSKFVARDLDICTRTYETKKKNLLDCGICIKVRSHKNVYRYQFKLKAKYQEETRQALILAREEQVKDNELKKQTRAEKKFNGYTKHYYVGELGEIVKQYKISMNKITKDLDPTLALEQAKATIKQYREKTNAMLIMDGWKKGYNAEKIRLERHNEYKKQLADENIAIKLANKMSGFTSNGAISGFSDIFKQQVTDDTLNTELQSLSTTITGQIEPLFTNSVILPTQRAKRAIEAKSDGHRRTLSNVELYMETNWKELYKVLQLNNKANPDKPLTQELTHALSLVKSKEDFEDIYYNIYLISNTIPSFNNQSLHRQVFTTLINTLGGSDNLNKRCSEYIDRHRYLE